MNRSSFPIPIPPRLRPGIWLLTCMWWVLGSDTSRAGNVVNVEMAKMAGQIKLLLDQKGLDAIAVGDFRGPAVLAATAGPVISKALTDELEKAHVNVRRRAELEVRGDYVDVQDKETQFLAVQIKAEIVDRRGERVVVLEPRGILDVTTIVTLIGVTTTLPAGATDKERDRTLTDSVDNRKVSLASTRIAAGADSPYAVEVLVKSGNDYHPRAASVDRDGFAFLKIRRDEIYAIRLINDSPFEAAVTLTIDGLSTLAFSANTNYTHWFVKGKQTLTVLGWHRTNKLSDSFQVTDYAKSPAAEKLSSPATVGTITATFAAAWPQGTPPPQDEPPKIKSGERAIDATGKGPAVETNFREVVRDIGRLRASVSLRYTKDDEPGNLPNARP
jgi:hypothetical protein